MHMHNVAMSGVSIHLSVTGWYTNNYKIMQFIFFGIPGTLVLWDQILYPKSQENTFARTANKTAMGKNSEKCRFLTNNL